MTPDAIGRVCAMIFATLLLLGTIVTTVAACLTGSGFAWLAAALLAGAYSWATYPTIWWRRR